MLTQIVGNRVYDFSHVVGGRDQVMGPVALAVGCGERELFAVITKIGGGCVVTRYDVGERAGDERIVNHIGERGEGDGRFEWPQGVAVDSRSNVYVADAWSGRVSAFTAEGEFLRAFGSEGDGKAQFARPSGIAAHNGDLLVVDTLNHRVQRLDPHGGFVSAFGKRGADAGEFDSPWGITTDADGFIYVADHKNHRIQKFDADGRFVFELGSYGKGKGEFDHPSDVAVDPAGDIYVCDWANHRVQAFDAEGQYIATFIGDAQELSKWQLEYVMSNPDVYKARRRVYSLEPEWRFAMPSAVAFDPRGSRLMVADTQRWRIQIYDKLLDYSEPQFNI